MDTDDANVTDALGDLAVLSTEVLEHVLLHLATAADVDNLSATCRAFAAMASDQRLWKSFYATLGAVDTGAAPEAWGKNWRWLCRARTTPASDLVSAQMTCGSRAYYGGCCIYHGQLLDGLPDGYGIMVFTTDAPGGSSTGDPRISNAFAWSPSRGSRFEGRWIAGLFVDGRCAFSERDAHAFSGIFRDGMVTGSDNYHEGTCVYSDGERFMGQMRDGAKTRGVSEYPDGRRYDGEWANGERNGQGSMSYPDGDRYEGQWKDSLFHGQGTLVTKSGTRREGQWELDLMNGKGIEINVRGFRFEGSYVNGKRTGHGVMTWSDGERREGDWTDGSLNGHGVMTLEDGTRYEGHFKNNERDGHGIIQYAGGDRYDGHWKASYRSGHGTYVWTSGKCYEGNYKNDKKHGRGTLSWPDGRCYKGEWERGMKQGRGVHRSAEYTYDGEWSQDKRHGRGSCQFPDGTLLDGLWWDDVFVGGYVPHTPVVVTVPDARTPSRKRAR